MISSGCAAASPPIFLNAMWATLFRPPAAREAASGRRGWAIVALTLTFCATLRLGAPAHAQTPLLQNWGLLNAKCRGGPSDDPKTSQACDKREKASATLKRRGCVYHEDGD
jgi:hypothetical protein